MRTSALRVGLPPQRLMFYPSRAASLLWLRGNHTALYRGCNKWKEAKAVLAKQVPEGGRKSDATGHPAAPKARRAGPSAEHMTWASGGITSSEGAC